MTKRDGVFEFLQHRILTHYPQARMILDGKMPAPRTAIVYPTYVCNQNCLWCEYAEDNARYHTLMPEDKLRKLIWDLHELGVRGVEFCGGGEPALHPALPELICEMKAIGVTSGLLTNGTRLKGALASALVDCASYVRVGLDGANAATADRLKRPNSREAGFEAVCGNVRDLVRLRNTRGAKVRISVKVILTLDNYTQVEECVKLAMALGVNSVQFKAARLTDRELGVNEAEAARQAIARCRGAYPGMAIVGSVDKLNLTRQCWLTPLQITVDPLGDVYLCCYYRHRKDRHRIGNAFEQPLTEIWYGERHWEAIRRIVPAECNLLDCRFVHYNETMTELIVENDAQFEFI